MATFTNPVTESIYRLRLNENTWRITKSRTENGVLVIRNLAGIVSEADVDSGLVDRLVRGERCLPEALGDPNRALVAVVLLDLNRTHDLVIAMAREAYLRFENGCRGFRPKAPHLKREAAQAVEATVKACRAMAMAWLDSHLVGEVPAWMTSAIDDASRDGSPVLGDARRRA